MYQQEVEMLCDCRNPPEPAFSAVQDFCYGLVEE